MMGSKHLQSTKNTNIENRDSQKDQKELSTAFLKSSFATITVLYIDRQFLTEPKTKQYLKYLKNCLKKQNYVKAVDLESPC